MRDGRPRSAVVTITVAVAVRKRGGRKLVLAPDGAPVPPLAPQVDGTLVKAIARAFRWQKMLETGQYATIRRSPTFALATRPKPFFPHQPARIAPNPLHVLGALKGAHLVPRGRGRIRCSLV
jgi:hypothetical protein